MTVRADSAATAYDSPASASATAAREEVRRMDESEEAILTAATNPDGSRRFYPPFEHPATARLREQQEKLEAFPESDDRDKALDWTKEQIARFELGEDRAKADYLRAHRGR